MNDAHIYVTNGRTNGQGNSRSRMLYFLLSHLYTTCILFQIITMEEGPDILFPNVTSLEMGDKENTGSSGQLPNKMICVFVTFC